MKQTLQKLLLVIVGLLGSAGYYVDTEYIDGVYYVFYDDGTAVVDNYINHYYTGNVIIPEKVNYNGTEYLVTRIGDRAFEGCTGLTSVTVGNSVTSIGYEAFSGCTGLTSVTIGNSVTSIGHKAFSGCTGLTSITIPRSVTSIGSSAFKDCNGLKELRIEDGVEILQLGYNSYNNDYSYSGGAGLFRDCNLETLYLGRNLSYNSDSSYGYSPFYWQTSLKSVTIGNSVITIGDRAFYYCDRLTSVTIPNSVTTIGDEAFYDCKGLTSLTIGNSVITIGDRAFEGCTGLTSVTIPNSVTTIGDEAFYDCKGLTSVTIGTSVTEIGTWAFRYTTSSGATSRIDIAKAIWLTNTPPSGYNDIESIINYVANDQYSELSNVKVYPYLSSMFEVDGIKYVPISPSERTCDAIDCVYDSTTNINIRNSVSFKGVAMTLKNINPCTFYNNYFIKSVNIDFNGNKIPDYCFYGCSSLPEITIPSNVTSIGDYVFDGCTSLTNVTIEDRDTELSLGSNGSSPMFSDCPLKTVYIGGNISYPRSSSYGYSPFYRNTTLETVTITDKETEISDNEFYGCSSLKNITMGDGVESIGNWAFSGCSSLDYFSFGTGMKTIGEEAFSDCTAMTKLISNTTTPPACGTQALDDINKWTCELVVPKNSLASYQAADQWKEFFFISESGIEDIVTDGNEISVIAQDGEIVVNGIENAMVEVYNINGQLVYFGSETTIAVADRGLYIVKVADKTFKVTL